MAEKSDFSRTEKLKREIRVELDKMDRIVEEIVALHEDFGEDTPTLRERAAAGQFLGSIYMEVENIFKRIIRFYELEMPEGEDWHVELFRRFRFPATDPLPVLLPDCGSDEAVPGFRHVVRHGYALDLEWERMRKGLQEARPVFEHFRRELSGSSQVLRGRDSSS